MNKSVATGGVVLGLVVLGCSSPAADSADVPSDAVVDGFYERRGGGGDVDWVLFDPAGSYTMGRAGIAVFEEGSYRFSDAKASVTFRSSTGQSTTLAFAVTGAGHGVTKPASYVLLGPPVPLLTQATTLLINGGQFELALADFFCKDASAVSPDSSNCGGQGSCGAGQLHCIRY